MLSTLRLISAQGPDCLRVRLSSCGLLGGPNLLRASSTFFSMAISSLRACEPLAPLRSAAFFCASVSSPASRV